MRLQTADGDALERVLDETHTIWSDGLTRRAYGQFNGAQLRTRWGSAHLRRIVLTANDGTVLSSAKRYDLPARLDGRPVSIVGLGAIFTPERSRGRGYAKTLIEEVLTAAAAEGADLALLFSEIDPAYYASLDFVPVPRRECHLRIAEKPGAPAVLVRGGADRDIPAVAALAQSMAGGYRFALEQSEDFIRFGLSKKRLLAGLLRPDLLNVEFFVVEEGASAAAFAIVTVTPEDMILEMCGDRDPSGARVGAMLQVLRARTPAELSPPLTSFLPPHWLPPQLEISSSSTIREVMMVRPLRNGVLDSRLTSDDVLYWHGDMI